MFDGIQVLITAGLGNQMFQYAAARCLSIRSGLPLVLDTSSLRGSNRWGFDLRHFRLCDHRVSSMPWRVFDVRTRIFRRMHALGLAGSWLWVERKLTFTPELLEIQGPCLLDGFFQSDDYSRIVADSLRADFEIVAEQDLRSAECERRIRNTNSVGLHVRRGDYVSNPHSRAMHGTCSKEYYDAALSLVLSKVGRDAEVFVFSDDMKWCRANIQYPLPITFVDWNANRNFEDMRLMSACRSQIIANSTFSWWGAWLNARPNKIVVAPANWYAQPGTVSDLPKAPWLIAI